jgi:protein-S-isoprenylcysteine O-methyltransferase Ste14
VPVGFAVLGYLAFLAIVGYSVAFLAGSGVPRTVDGGGPRSGTPTAVVVDLLLLSLFGVQHSVMARPGFKRRWTRLVPEHLERSSYVLATAAVLALLFWQWRAIPAVVWQISTTPARAAIWVLFGAGWAVVGAMTFAFDHLDFVGLRQVRHYVRGRRAALPEFRMPLPYRLVRHPMMTGLFVAVLATPTMTAGHFLFALVSCAYILGAVRLEERDLGATLPGYPDYAATTPRFVPRPARRAQGAR